MKLNVRVWMWSVGTFSAVTFTLCTIYGLLAPPALHASQFLEMILPGFHWLSFGSFLLGLVETFLYGAYLGLVFVPIHNFYLGRLERPQKQSVQKMAA